MKKTTYYLSKQSSCFAILINEEIKAGDFMADKNGIYECPEIDGFIGFLKVVACTEKKGNLPLIDEKQIFVPNQIKHEKFWVAKIEVDDLNLPKVRNGFINLIGIQIPKKQ
jgi:hypothetical protein